MIDDGNDLNLIDEPPDPNDLYDQLSKELFPSWSLTFDKQRNVFCKQLINLNALIFILDKIVSFPFRIFKPHDRDFWVVSFGSMYESCVLLIYRIWFDNRKDVITLFKLMEQVQKRLTRVDFQSQFSDRRSAVSGVDWLNGSKESFKKARNKRFAHLDREFLINQSTGKVNVDEPSVSDIERAAKILSEYFECLCFDSGRSVHRLRYNPTLVHSTGSDSRTDIEKLLDVVARDSDLLKLPETNPCLWSALRDNNNISDSELEIFNKYRTKFGMSEVS